MVDSNTSQQQPSQSTQHDSGGGLDDLLTSLQQGVTAINNLTQSIKAIFSSS